MKSARTPGVACQNHMTNAVPCAGLASTRFRSQREPLCGQNGSLWEANEGWWSGELRQGRSTLFAPDSANGLTARHSNEVLVVHWCSALMYASLAVQGALFFLNNCRSSHLHQYSELSRGPQKGAWIVTVLVCETSLHSVLQQGVARSVAAGWVRIQV